MQAPDPQDKKHLFLTQTYPFQHDHFFHQSIQGKYFLCMGKWFPVNDEHIISAFIEAGVKLGLDENHQKLYDLD